MIEFDEQDHSRYAEVKIPGYPFYVQRVDEPGVRRGYQIAFCEVGFRCCGAVTVLRSPYVGGEWGVPEYFWAGPVVGAKDRKLNQYMNALELARRLGRTIPVTGEFLDSAVPQVEVPNLD